MGSETIGGFQKVSNLSKKQVHQTPPIPTLQYACWCLYTTQCNPKCQHALGRHPSLNGKRMPVYLKFVGWSSGGQRDSSCIFSRLTRSTQCNQRVIVTSTSAIQRDKSRRILFFFFFFSAISHLLILLCRGRLDQTSRCQ